MILQYFLQGGPVMFCILAASIIAMAVFIERFVYLERTKRDARVLTEKMREKLSGHRIDEAIATCDNRPGPAANILKAGLLVSEKSRSEIELAMEDAAKYEMPRLYRNLPVLQTIASVSTLLGLLGTVLGMIASSVVLSTQGMSNPSKLIGGIAQALVCTAGGLCVAIPTLVGYNYMAAKTDKLISDLEIVTTELVKLLKKDREPTARNW
jgi:biopolymer transport protein ExbB